MTDEKKQDIASDDTQGPAAPTRTSIRIGSQRDPQPTRPDPPSDVEVVPPTVADEAPVSADALTGPPTTDEAAPVAVDAPTADREISRAADELFPAPPIKRVSADLQAEIDAALGDSLIDDLMASESQPAGKKAADVELDERRQARVIKCDRESVFVSLGEAHEGVAARRQFAEAPEPGSLIDVIPTRYLTEENLYEVIVPGASVDVQDWSDLSEGVIVEVRVTGHNKGGLECEINQIRGFIPVSQLSLYRVEDMEPFVGQPLQCVVTEANPERRNLVLSHRAVLEREKQAAREQLLEELEVGQIREGIVRRLQDFGAFVDLGGIDGLIHVSQLSWDRVSHPRDVLEEGQKVQVRIEKIDIANGRIGLSYRDLLEDPWQDAETKFGVGQIVPGTVTKIMEFGAFVRLASGVEGLVHISEIAHHRVHKVAAFVKEGQDVQVKVISVDRENQRIGLSMKAVQAAPSDANSEEAEPELTPRVVPDRNEPLKGGLGRNSGGDQFGLNW